MRRHGDTATARTKAETANRTLETHDLFATTNHLLSFLSATARVRKRLVDFNPTRLQSELSPKVRALMPGKKPSVIVTRRLPEGIEARSADLFRRSLNQTDTPMDADALRAAVATAEVLCRQ